MRRGSLIAPIILILAGVLFLVNNLHPEWPLLRTVGQYWPFLLIAWGALRAIEVVIWHLRRQPLPRAGISGGEWVLIILIVLAGGGIHMGYRYRDHFPKAQITTRGIEILGETFDFPLSGQLPCGRNPRILVDNLRGNARLIGGDVAEVKVSGRSTVRAFQKGDAEKVNQKCPLEMRQQGDQIIIRTNQDRASGPEKVSADLEITVPRGATLIEGRGRYGDFDIHDIEGGVDIDSDNAGVRLSGIGRDVRVNLRKSDIVRVVKVKGSVEVKGGGWDIEMEDIAGPVDVDGSYSGELSFRALAKALRFTSSSSNLRVESIPGELRISRGELTGYNLVGPVVISTRSKDVSLRDFTQSLELTLERGDIELWPGRLPLSAMTVRSRSGDIDLAVPAGARFQLKASTERGEVENLLGGGLVEETRARGEIIQGSVGGGPLLSLETDRGTVRIRQAALAEAPLEPPKPPKPQVPPKPAALEVEQQ